MPSVTISWLKLTTPPPDPRRDELGDVHRRDERRGADRKPEPEAAGEDLPVRLRQRAPDGAGDHLRPPPADLVGQPAGDEGAGDGAEQQDRDRELLLPVRLQPEVLLHEEHRAADDAGVVAEEEAADRGDERDTEKAPVA